jgi:hypothetical protein
MNENIEFKNIIANAGNGGVLGNKMKLMPYAKNLQYKDGALDFCLEFYSDGSETEIGLNIKLDDDLCDLIEGLLFEQ